MSSAPEVILYSRKGCHLCDVVKNSLTRLSETAAFTWQVIDIDADPELVCRFNEEVPVVFIRGQKAFKYQMDEREFLRKLASRS